MISNELKEELKEKKNLIALFLFGMIMLVLTSWDIGLVFFLIIFIAIVFNVLKWIFWIFLKPSSKDEEKIIKSANNAPFGHPCRFKSDSKKEDIFIRAILA